MTELMAASKQWAQRPDDERFLSIDDLYQKVNNRRINSQEGIVNIADFNPILDGIQIDGSGLGDIDFTNWSFGQICQFAKAPAAYLRTLPDFMVRDLLALGLSQQEGKEVKALVSRNGGPNLYLRAITGKDYGRIWDAEIVEAVRDNIDLEKWKVPGASYASKDPKRATTLYSGDRDMFMFLVDESRPIEVPGNNGIDTLYRGFYSWNSETGSSSYGLSTFLYRTVCDNRIIWGAQDVKEVRVRHTSQAPSRYYNEALPALMNHTEASEKPVVEMVQKARETRIADTRETVEQYLRRHGVAQGAANKAIDQAHEEPGDPFSVWNLTNALTAMAREKVYAGTRTADERQAGKLLEMAI